MPQFAGSINQYPARASLSWYAALIVIGFLTLYFIPSCAGDSEAPISLLEALFTATSAACVTGLTVRSTSGDFSMLGQGIILALIQLGGIGIMTVTTFIVVQFNKRGSIRQRQVVAETLGASGDNDLRRILWKVIAMTLGCEALGFLVLASHSLLRFDHYQELGLWATRGEALWHALFHSVSAFCNAGFSLNDDSLVPFAGDPIVTLTIGLLIVVGGLGFPVFNDLWRHRHSLRQNYWKLLQMHTKIMLLGTAALLLFGFASFLVLEWDGAISDASLMSKLNVAMSHSINCRTAGFNSVEIPQMTNAMLFISIVLMSIGGGPCSTAGGFKVTTAAIIAMRAWSTFRGFPRVNLYRRTIPPHAVERAIATAMLFAAVAGLALTTILVIEQSGAGHLSSKGLFLEALFEIISALGTVGLSTGLTNTLSDVSLLIVVVLMLLGRLGPISTFAALSYGQRSEPIEYPNEEPLVG
ncbi:Ktr system potassium uptake protein B [Pseudobythopirellula maris]|uniref:Ktr system potassium uptake protein B n=1 Tax=Pseudobythopirellula maris TaxID=2527991 RepID=A0A5C5ZLJ5_9BACT|nr:potassium transporter TrkG [Pseudobythopirellula maris]TWT88322.1 Ktr system potassium uptake protein B [Pseudobythopirellula maris]